MVFVPKKIRNALPSVTQPILNALMAVGELKSHAWKVSFAIPISSHIQGHRDILEILRR